MALLAAVGLSTQNRPLHTVPNGWRRNPGKGGTTHLGLAAFNTVREAVAALALPLPHSTYQHRSAKRLHSEAIDQVSKLIITITKGILTLDMLTVKVKLTKPEVRMIGPNCPGVITPGECKSVSSRGHIHKPGKVGIAPVPVH